MLYFFGCHITIEMEMPAKTGFPILRKTRKGEKNMRYSIEGGSLPAVVFEMDAGDVIISEVGGRVWSKGPVETETRAEGGLGKSLGRMFTGESIFISRYTASGPSEMVFASSYAGKIVARELAAGESIICQKSAFLCAFGNVELALHMQKKIATGFFGGEGFIMQRVTGPGVAFFEIDGYCKEYDLAPGEEIVCDTGALSLMDATCQMDVRMVKGLKNKFLGGEGLVDTVVSGPGKVYLQTMSVSKLAAILAPFLPNKS